MTLSRQLWMTVAALMLTSFVGSFLVSCFSAKAYLEEQLYLKNNDNASSLALALSNAGDDPTARELLLAAQFDTGHYAYIRLQSPQGELVLGDPEREVIDDVPRWVVSVFPIHPQPGVAQVSQGWETAGTITLQSASAFAYRELWKSTWRLFEYFSAAALAAGLLGTLLLRWITRPLAAVVAQAEAIGERRFVIIEEPRTLEFRALTRAMNGLSTRVKQMLVEESERLGRWHRESRKDPLTGLLAREPFLEQLAALLKREDATAQGVFAIARMLHLSELNRRHGRPVMDALLLRFANELEQQAELHEGMVAGRLNGSELGMVVPMHTDPRHVVRSLRDALLAGAHDLGLEVELAAAGTLYGGADGIPQLMQRTDQALAAVEQRAGGGVEIADPEHTQPQDTRDEFDEWSARLSSALDSGRFRLETYPVWDRDGALLHSEAFTRLRAETGPGEWRAAQFMPWAARLGRMVDLDLWVVGAALRQIEESDHSSSLAINLSTRLLEQPAALDALIAQIRSAPRCAPLLWLEVPEDGVYGRIAGFRSLCAALQPLGCRLGVEHAGPQIARLGALYDVGLHYVKLEAALIRNIESRPGNQAFVRGLCTIAHAIGLQAIAEAVESQDEWRVLLDLGIDGGTGRLFGSPR